MTIEQKEELLNEFKEWLLKNVKINNYTHGGEEVAGLFAVITKVLIPNHIDKFIKYLDNKNEK